MKTAIALVIATIAGGSLMAADLAWPAWRWGGWVAVLPLFFAIYRCRPSFACLLGACWGASVYLATTNISPGVLLPGFTSPALLMVAPAVFALFGAHLTRWLGFSAISLGVAWMGVEFMLRPIGLNHGLLGSAIIEGALGHWLGQTLGYICVACLVAWINAIIVAVITKVCTAGVTSSIRTCSAGLRHLQIPQIEFNYSCLSILCSRPRAPPA